MDNDAKAFYDMIICNLAITISQYFGMPQNTYNMQAKPLENMEFRKQRWACQNICFNV